MSIKTIFEGAIKTSNEKMDEFKKNIDQVFNGTQVLSPGEYKTAGVRDRIADIGILGVLGTVSSLDLCSLLSYQVNLLRNIQGYKFDPNLPPISTSPQIVKKAYALQYQSYVIQSTIDEFIKSENRDIPVKDLQDPQGIIVDLINQLNHLFNTKYQGSIADKELLGAFPILLISNLYLNQARSFFSKLDLPNLKQKDVQKIMFFINNTRTHCIKIQSINIYSSYNYATGPALQVIDNAANSILQKQLAQLNSIIGKDLSKLVPMLQTIRIQVSAITKFCQTVLSTIRAAQSYVNIAVTLVKILTVVTEFLKSLPIPNEFTVVGINVRFGDALKKINDFIDTIVQDLNSISGLLKLLSSIVADIYVDVQTIINDISQIITNLEACNNAPKGLVDDLKSTLGTLKDTSDQLNAFLQNNKNKTTQINNTYGGYTIQIIKEELLQNSNNIPRRYGIALDSDGVQVVKTTPTYASNDAIIIEEVKLLLESKKLIKIPLSSLSSDQQSSINEALSYVEGNTISPDVYVNINDGLDSPDNEDENSGLGLNAFMNKQKGGKALRNRMRATMAKANSQLQQNLSTVNQG
jgi:hypothetical protein